MKVGIIGSGGREHAICHALNKSKKINKIYCFPGNAGTAKIGTNVIIDFDNFIELKNFILEKTVAQKQFLTLEDFMVILNFLNHYQMMSLIKLFKKFLKIIL